MKYDDMLRVELPCGCIDGICLSLHTPHCKHYRTLSCPACESEAVRGEFGVHCYNCGWYWDAGDEQTGVTRLRPRVLQFGL
jgi:hypothetical protein